MIYALTILGLVLIPFYDFIFRIFPNVSVIAIDTRGQREMMAIIIALAIGLSALYHGSFKPFKNKWILLFIILQVISLGSFNPHFPLLINGVDNSGFWVWKPLFMSLCFLLMGIAIFSKDFSKKELNNLLKVMLCVGVVESVYLILQSLGIDQFNIVRSKDIIGHVFFPERVGTLGQPTIIASFIAMLVPLSFYFRKYLLSLLMIVSVCLTHSQMAIGAMIIGIIIYCILLNPKSWIVIVPQTIFSSIMLFLNGIIHVEFNGRIGVLKILINEIMKSKLIGFEGQNFSFFGYGLGSFRYISEALDFHFGSAHNEYLEIFYCCGIFGLVLVLSAIFYMLFNKFNDYLDINYPDGETRIFSTLISSFSIICLCALGSFVWQLGAHIFYTVVLVGLLSKEKFIGGENV